MRAYLKDWRMLLTILAACAAVWFCSCCGVRIAPSPYTLTHEVQGSGLYVTLVVPKGYQAKGITLVWDGPVKDSHYIDNCTPMHREDVSTRGATWGGYPKGVQYDILPGGTDDFLGEGTYTFDIQFSRSRSVPSVVSWSVK